MIQAVGTEDSILEELSCDLRDVEVSSQLSARSTSPVVSSSENIGTVLGLAEVNTDLDEITVRLEGDGDGDADGESISRFGVLKQRICVKASHRLFLS